MDRGSDPDCYNELSKINFVQQYWTGIEYVGISLPILSNPICPNPNPGQATNPATPDTNQIARPTRAPYVIHWDASNTPVYYSMKWNEHILLRCGWTLEFNIVLNILT